MKNGGSFHSYVNVYQRVAFDCARDDVTTMGLSSFSWNMAYFTGSVVNIRCDSASVINIY